MSQRMISGLSLAGMLVVALSLQSCGGGGGGAAFNLPTAGPTPATVPTATFSVMTKNEAGVVVEAPEVKDDPVVYAVEQGRVMEASVITMDIAASATAPAITFADVNADIDDTDASTPEIDAHLVIDGVGGYLEDGAPKNSKIRLRGSSSRLAEQKSYRLKLNSTAAAKVWRGETTLQLNKHPYDLSRLRNKLAFDLFREIPHVASLRTQFIHMTVTNKDALGVPYASADFGLFTHVEKMGKEYLTNRNLPTDGNVYKAEDFDFTAGGASARETLASAMDANGKVTDKAKFETVLSLEADNTNHLPLIAMIDDVNNEAIPFDTTFNKYFDKANYLTWLASNILMGNRDTINQNFGLYQPKAGTKFYFVPWDYDGAFGFEDQPTQLAAGPLYADWQKTVANWWGIPLHRRFLQDPKHLAELKLAVNEIYDNYLTKAQINAKLDAYKPLVMPLVKALPDSRYLPVVSNTTLDTEWETERLRLANVVAANRDAFFIWVEAPMPFWQAATFQSPTQVLFNWDTSIDLQGDAVTYSVQVAASPDFAAGSVLVANAANGSSTTYLYTSPTNFVSGTAYYLKVTATSKDSSGRTYQQSAFDRFEVVGSSARYFGVSEHKVP
jgi:spore coat protein H